MTLPAAGWYADPTAPPGDNVRLRYWDGAAWTDQVHVQPPAYAGYAGYPAGQPAPGYAQPGYPAYGVPAVPSTPDGVPLAGWWSRVLAQLIDGILLTPVLLLVIAPIVASRWDEITAWYDGVSNAVDHGTAAPPFPSIFDPTTATGLAFILVPALVSLVYSIGFLRWKQATPGKLALGLRIRMRETPGPLPWSAILSRVGFVAGLSVLAAIPYLGAIFSLASLLNYLWPLWDSKKQALHDKVAGTNVVKTR